MTLLSAVLLLTVAYVMVCRISKMAPRVTEWYVAAQHAALGFAAFASALLLAIRPEASAATLGAGVLAFFLLSTHRWRQAPADTESKPMELDPLQGAR